TGQLGTVVKVTLDEKVTITPHDVMKYLRPYVQFVPVPIYVNGTLISQQSIEAAYVKRTSDFRSLGEITVTLGVYAARVHVYADSNAQVACTVRNIRMGEHDVVGDVIMSQGGGQVMGLRNFFGLASAPIGGCFNMGGVANLTILHPTAGREALSRES